MERIVSWSARHPVKAIVGWCLLVLLAIASSSLASGEGARNIDPGETGTATRVLIEQDGYNPVRESVLIQTMDGGGAGFRENPELRKAAQDLVRALQGTSGAVTDIGSPLGADRADLVSADGRSALVTFQIAGTPQEVKPNRQQRRAQKARAA